jgi:hypothetical protein
LKTVRVQAHGGSNPSPSAIKKWKIKPLKSWTNHDIFIAVALNMARWRSGLTHMPFTHAFRGSNPLRVTKHGRLAQLGEHLPYKQGVGGSIPSAPTILILTRGGAVRQLVGLITRRSQVQILSPQPKHGAVVKLEFTPVCHTGGRGFESRQLRHV